MSADWCCPRCYGDVAAGHASSCGIDREADVRVLRAALSDLVRAADRADVARKQCAEARMVLGMVKPAVSK